MGKMTGSSLFRVGRSVERAMAALITHGDQQGGHPPLAAWLAMRSFFV